MKWDLLINGNPDQQAEMTVVQDAWEKYGLKLEICTMDPQTCISETVSYTHLDVYKRQAEDNAGNMSDAIFARFMFEQTEPVAEKTLTPDHWTNGTVEIDLSTDDNLSGVQDITLPDGNIVDAAQAKYTVCLLYTSRCV